MLLDLAMKQNCVNAMCSQKDHKGNTLALKLVTGVVKAGHAWSGGPISLRTSSTMLTTGFDIVQEILKFVHQACDGAAFNVCNNAGASPTSVIIKVSTSAEASC